MTQVDENDYMIQRWECEPPPPGSTMRVLDDEWGYGGEKPVRIIRRVEVLHIPAAESPRAPLTDPARIEIERRILDEILPKLHESSGSGGYNCCGCSTYAEIVDDVLQIVRDERVSGD
jgi:hypothetical protein